MLLRGAVAPILILAALASDAHGAGPFDARVAAYSADLRARGRAPDAIAPLAGLLRLEENLPPGALVPVLRELVDGGRAHPLVGAQAALALATEEERAGDDAGAKRHRAALGLWHDFWVLGPFDAQGRSGVGQVFPPELKPPDPRRTETFPGKEREVGWRRAPEGLFREGALLVDGMLRPSSEAVAYVLAVVSSPVGRPAVLRLGSAGPIKVWVNGVAVHERSAVRPAVLDQDAVGIRLRAGENWVLIKTLVTAGAWRLFARFTDATGRPLGDLTATRPRGVAPALHEARAGERFPFADLSAELRQRATRLEAAKAPEAPRAWLDVARFLAFVQPDDVEDQAAEGALEKAGDETEALLLLAEVAREDDDRRAALEKVAGRTGAPVERALALAGLGDLARQRRRETAASGYWRAALAADPTCWPASLALAFDEQAAGLSSGALARIDALPADVRAATRVARARARILEALGRRVESEASLTALQRLRRTDLDLLQDLAGIARNRGDLARAAALHGEAAARRPDLIFLTIEAAHAYEGLGDLEKARALLADAALRLPDEARVHEELGRLLARAERIPEAVAALARALELRPQNPTLRRYAERLSRITPEGGADTRTDAADDLARAHAADAEALSRAAMAEAARPSDGGDGVVVLLDRRVVRVHRNGLSETFAQRVVQLRSDRAARENQEFFVRYTPGSQEVEIRKARIFRAAGDELDVSEATGRDDRDLSEPWYGLYYDNRAEVVTYEDLRAGDVIEVQYTVADVGRNEMSDYFGDFDFIGETSSKRRWDYTLIGPAERTFYFNQPRLPGLQRSTTTRGGEVVHSFVAKDVPRIQPEPAMPGFAEVAPYLHVSTYKTWDDVGRWYWHLVEDQLTADHTLRRAAADATRGLHTTEEKVRALHRLVLDGTRYVALEFGIHGFKPYKVTQVLARRFGDCKDKASLLLALLREAGIESQLVLVRTRRGGRIDPAPASLAVFDHAIVYVPALSLYLDGTAEFSGMNELPDVDQGVMVLRVGPKASTPPVLVETPVFPSAANLASRVWNVDLDEQGGGMVAEDLTIKGQAAPEWRTHYQTPGEREERYGKIWSALFPGANLQSLRFDGIEDRNHPVTLHARVQVPQLGEPRASGGMALPVAARETELVRSFARLSSRRHDLQIAYPWQHQDELVFHLPVGWRVARQPVNRKIENPFGRFELELALSDGGRSVRVRSFLDVQHARVTPAEYGAFRKFLGLVDAALAERIVIVKERP